MEEGRVKRRDTHTGSVCAEAERIMGVKLAGLHAFRGEEGIWLLLKPAEWEEPERHV